MALEVCLLVFVTFKVLAGCKGLGGLPYTENRENNQSAFRLPSG
jgi:hypothetical protein